MKAKRNHHINHQNITITLFCIMLFAPTITFPVFKQFLPVDNSENRNLAKKPELSLGTIASYPTRFQQYYNDHLPYRNILRTAWSDLNFYAFHDSTSQKVLLGNNTSNMDSVFLFYSDETDGNPVAEVQGITSFPTQERDIIIDSIKDNIKKANNINAAMYYLIAPDKENVYREYLPKTVKIYNDKSRTDTFVEYANSHGVDIIYPRQELLAAKDAGQTYYRQDTHWNDFGAFIAFQTIMKKIAPQYEPNYTVSFSYQVDSLDDISKLLGLSGNFYDYIPSIDYLEDANYTIETIDLIDITHNDNAPIKKTVMLFGDSYRHAIKKYFFKTFEKCIIFNKGSYNRELLKEYHPDIIIHESVERFTNQIPFELY